MAASLRRSSQDLPDLKAALKASGVVGTWLYDVRSHRIAVSAQVGRRLGLRPELAESGLHLTAFADALHRADRSRFTAAFEAAAERGGPLDLTVRNQDGAARVSLRGQIACDSRGRPHQGCGIALAPAFWAGEKGHDQAILNRMAEHAIALRDLCGDLRQPGLSAAIEDVMMEIGFELARQLQAGRPELPH
ncbi:MAG: diguanylate cyclase [Methylobacterium sp.]|uniref:diguanylate cyclase n=1 Tax=Methylobacterium sp. TaxID=409 RepID=UPI0025EF0383|nr:diguanylate cyclase [Methylobacterium sp.]MBX9931100.1 diguanylate cyclase [Methylobacterium sp.]